MTNTPAIIARRQAKRTDQLREGTVVSFTTVAHPPEGFDHAPIQIGLIILDDGTQVLAPLLGSEPQINDRVVPRMRCTRVNDQGLRIYEVAYELVVRKPVETHVHHEFPGYILALTGPSGVGKSTVSRLLSTVLSEYTAPVPILTTRGEKAGDEGEYTYVTVEEFLDLKNRGEIIAFSRIPSATEERWYGYREKDIDAIWQGGKVPVVITEMHLLQGLAAHFGRRSILSCGLLPPGSSKRAMLSQLLHRLRSRGRDTEESIRDRMKNAASDLQFFENRKELFDHMLVNEDLDTVVASLKGHVLSAERA